MKPPVFKYTRVESLEQVLSILDEAGNNAKVLAGGQSLVPLLSFRLARPTHLLDINALTNLAYVRHDNGTIRIGALTRQRELLTHAVFREHCPILVAAGAHIGHPAIRNRGTIGGSVAHADPAAELPVVFLALDATFHVRTQNDARAIRAVEFFTGPLMTSMSADELLTEISFAIPTSATGWGFQEVARRYGDFALAAAAVVLRMDAKGRVARAAVALGGVTDRPVRAEQAERLLIGEDPTLEILEGAARSVIPALDPVADMHAGEQFRGHLARVLTKRALADAVRRAGEGRG